MQGPTGIQDMTVLHFPGDGHLLTSSNALRVSAEMLERLYGMRHTIEY